MSADKLKAIKQLQVLFVGLGSIGTRHLKNLHELSGQNGISLTVHALRNSLSRALPNDVKALVQSEFTLENINSAPDYDIVFITNPTVNHYEAMRVLKDKTHGFFIEKPIFEHCGYKLSDCINKGQKAYIAAPMRYCKTMLVLKEMLSNLNVYSIRAICSSYLPDWRKGVDYTKVYSAHKEMGGGVDIDLIHEWDYLTQLFGAPKKVCAFSGTYSHLQINSCDLAVYIAQFEKQLCELHLDYFGRDYKRILELYCENGTVIADFGAGTLTLENKQVIDCTEDVNERYIRELEYYLSYYASDEIDSTNTPESAMQTLKIALGEF